jgi:arginyl-tRNA--protein-N-Asp/Glu arginylyltransferase
LLLHDDPGPCPYLTQRTAVMPLRLPARVLTAAELDQRLGAGDRRQGCVLYHTECPACRGCIPLRVDVDAFKPSRAQQRTLRGTSRICQVEVGRPYVDERRVWLYNRHKELRGLTEGQSPIDARHYRDFLVATCCDTYELRLLLDGELIGVAIFDRGERSMSAVYCYYDPTFSKLGLGTFAILKQLELCRLWNLERLYLGLYIPESSKMDYKSRFYPHETLIGGRWQRTEQAER